jgi:demethylmenaquinone methyltransferase/2-methoxy-6-polyprenyl-1,4-benzoquinol methylase
MTDTSSNNNAHLQNKLVKDSIDHNQDISAQILRAQTAASNKDNSNNDFTKVQDLPTGTPQGQQTTMPNTEKKKQNKETRKNKNKMKIKKTKK